MNNKYLYYQFESAVSIPMCEQYKTIGINKIKEDKDMNIDTTPLTYEGKDLNRRKGEVAFLQEKQIFDKVLEYVFDANENAGWYYHVDCTEALQFSHYRQGDFTSWHSDGGSDHFFKYHQKTEENKNNQDLIFAIDDMQVGKVRKLSAVINLSQHGSDYEGGDLYIRNIDGSEVLVDAFRKQGSIVVFPSYHEHIITEITKGDRYSIVLWCLGAPFK